MTFVIAEFRSEKVLAAFNLIFISVFVVCHKNDKY
jgi:hypothetical protein